MINWRDDGHAMRYLEAQGFVLRKNFTWWAPREPTTMESSALRYLIYEWDFDGITE